MTTFYLVLVVLVVIAATTIFIASRQPDEFTISRSLDMTAPAARIFAQVNDLHHWEVWSPWIKADPKAKTRYEGELAGVGSTFHWDGTRTGAGSMTITESVPFTLIRFRLDFLRPFACTNRAEFTFAEAGLQTRVTWGMSGRNTLPSKIFSLVFCAEGMVGKAFEQGLADLRTIVEAGEAAG